VKDFPLPGCSFTDCEPTSEYRRLTVVTAIAETAAKTVLICEDDPNLRTLVRLALGDDGYRFFEAPDGPSGLALARRTQPDLIVLDLMLPGRSGLDVLRELRNARDFAETPVIVISAWSHSDDAAVQAGADRFVAKPFDPDELRDAAIALLEDDSANE
jgi:DNA-binding response OmpR family regulator